MFYVKMEVVSVVFDQDIYPVSARIEICAL
jgi:hypothetical protein